MHTKGHEYLEIDLSGLHVLTKVEVQGRFGNGQGLEFAPHYKLQYWRPGMDNWATYKNAKGDKLFEGNTNTYLATASILSPAVVASRVRFVPYSDHPRTVCMRVEVFGCPYADGLLAYSMPDGDVQPGGFDAAFRDITYDGNKRGQLLRGGLGQLTDGEAGHTNFRVDAMGRDRGELLLCKLQHRA